MNIIVALFMLVLTGAVAGWYGYEHGLAIEARRWRRAARPECRTPITSHEQRFFVMAEHDYIDRLRQDADSKEVQHEPV
jgi:hypothetical protein